MGEKEKKSGQRKTKQEKEDEDKCFLMFLFLATTFQLMKKTVSSSRKEKRK